MQKIHVLTAALVAVVGVQSLILAGQLHWPGNKSEAQKPSAQKISPAKTELIPGTDLKRILLTEKAAKRLDIKTAVVRDEAVARARVAAGEIAIPAIALPAGAPATTREGISLVAQALPGAIVRVPLTSDLANIARGQPATVLSTSRTGATTTLTARPTEAPAGKDAKDAPPALHYRVDGTGHGLVEGQRVRVEFPLADSGTPRKVVPYPAIIYDAKGGAWVYTSPAPLTFVRHRVTVDYVAGDLAVLSDGPPSGTTVVTVGGMELYGTEFFVGN